MVTRRRKGDLRSSEGSPVLRGRLDRCGRMQVTGPHLHQACYAYAISLVTAQATAQVTLRATGPAIWLATAQVTAPILALQARPAVSLGDTPGRYVSRKYLQEQSGYPRFVYPGRARRTLPSQCERLRWRPVAVQSAEVRMCVHVLCLLDISRDQPLDYYGLRSRSRSSSSSPAPNASIAACAGGAGSCTSVAVSTSAGAALVSCGSVAPAAVAASS